jgi:hypothetical protein
MAFAPGCPPGTDEPDALRTAFREHYHQYALLDRAAQQGESELLLRVPRILC